MSVILSYAMSLPDQGRGDALSLVEDESAAPLGCGACDDLNSPTDLIVITPIIIASNWIQQLYLGRNESSCKLTPAISAIDTSFLT